MTQWTRTIGRQVTNGMPAWRTAMTATNTLYEIGDLPNIASGKLVWPSAGANNYLMINGGDSNAYRMHDGYGGAVWVPDASAPDGGPWGSMVFGTTGEGVVSNQLTAFTMSDATPTWNFFQQPTYATSLAEAIAMDADWYYSEADYAALPSGKKIDVVGEASFVSTWDKSFPVGWRSWVVRRKHSGSLTGNNRPHWFRYQMPAYIPASMTGTGHGAIIVNQRGTQYGPFSQGHIPSGATEDDWFADMWGVGGRRKYFLYAMDVVTRAWTKMTNPVPDFAIGYTTLDVPFACTDEANKRVYYLGYSGGNLSLYYADFSGGIAGMTVSSPATLTSYAGGPATSQNANSVLCVPRSGALAGKRLWLMREASTSNLLLVDIDNGALRRLSLTGLPTSGEFWGFAYDAASNRVYITTKNVANGVRSFRFTIPDDYTNAAAYTVASQTVALNGVTLESVADTRPYQYGNDRTRFHEGLGVILMTQINNKMLAYRPA